VANQGARLAVFLLLALPALAACVAPALYGSSAGPYAVGHADGLVLHDAVQSRDIAVRVVYPQAPGRFPVVVYSHGAFCYPQHYAVITDHWAAHGYVVVLPDHPDSPNNPSPPGPDQASKLTAMRIADMNFVFGHLDDIAAAAGIAGRIDSGRLAVAGHSFGTVMAMAKSGLWVRTADGGRQQYLDSRIRGAVIMSGVGQMDDMMAPDAFSGLTMPLIATGGTLDLGNVGRPPVYPWEWRMSPYTLAPPGDKYSVVLENGDHYLGGLICRPDRGGDDDPQGAAIDAALTLAFLDAYVKENSRAARFLATADVPALTAGRARFARK
jgi:predicted dienelactone hydrolase